MPSRAWLGGGADQGTWGMTFVLERVPVCSQTQNNRVISMNHHDRRPHYHIENREKKPIPPGRREQRLESKNSQSLLMVQGRSWQQYAMTDDCPNKDHDF